MRFSCKWRHWEAGGSNRRILSPPCARRISICTRCGNMRGFCGAMMAQANQKNHNGWSAERRARASLLIRKHAPWCAATGPRSEAGKRVSSQNAKKHGNRSAEWREFYALLAAHRRRVDYIAALIRLKRAARATLRPALHPLLCASCVLIKRTDGFCGSNPPCSPRHALARMNYGRIFYSGIAWP